jgi:hypothetical protein
LIAEMDKADAKVWVISGFPKSIENLEAFN